LGTRTAVELIRRFKTPERIFRSSISELEAAGVAGGMARSITSGCAFDDAVTQQQKMAAAGAELVALTDPRYPARLKEIYDPPPMLFARGRVDLLARLAIAVVGTRRPSTYGTIAATRLAADLANAGLVIVSGMARGIDSAAHKATLDAGGDTIAVYGCGVDELYPAENRKLSEQIAERGLLLSDFPMGTPPYPQNFPMRNRVVSGLSLGVLVVEGGQYSGSAITARLAADQGREVFAVPGNITSKTSWGPNLLIKQGAKLVQEWNDVVVEFKPEDRLQLAQRCRNRLNLKENEESESGATPPASLDFGPLTSLARAILNGLKTDAAVGLDGLIESLPGNSPSEIIATLFELEISGLIRQLPGKSFMRVWLE
jgi:DNA processing protein